MESQHLGKGPLATKGQWSSLSPFSCLVPSLVVCVVLSLELSWLVSLLTVFSLCSQVSVGFSTSSPLSTKKPGLPTQPQRKLSQQLPSWPRLSAPPQGLEPAGRLSCQPR